MDLRQLQALVAIADHGTFSAAAAALHTVQSNVSSHVARLEGELGVQLVDRHGGALTEEGEAVVERARRIAAELDAAVSDVAAMRSEVTGSVSLGMIGTTAQWLAPLLVDRLAERHPKVRLVIGDGTSITLEPRLVSGALDMTVVNLPRTSPDLSERALFDEDLLLVVAAEDPLAGRDRVTMRDLDGRLLLLPASGTAFREEIDSAARAAGVSLVAKAEVDGVRLMASLCFRGYGPAILPATGTTDMGDRFATTRVEGLPPRRVGVMVRRRGRPSAPARALLDVLDEVIAADLSGQYGLHPPSGS
ncbi:MAG: LysR family transcriptional regulator [Actinomycetota bacterium]|nr:LysR family transcriptional regulator [Actinomycetota bacterium]